MPLLSSRPLSPMTTALTTAVPPAVRAAVEQATGAPVGDVPIHRGEPSAHAAKSMQARAFTDNGEVHLPEHHGPLDTTGSSSPAQALLAHELVHVVQQKRLGDTRPPEHSEAGRRLEREAQAVEHAVAHQANGHGPLPLPKPSWSDPGTAAVKAGVAQRAPDGSVVFTSPPADAPEPPAPVSSRGPQRAIELKELVVKANADDEPNPESTPLDVDKLYEQIRRRLKAELRLDRQRAGRSNDPRR
jgi:hypothetical protein